MDQMFPEDLLPGKDPSDEDYVPDFVADRDREWITGIKSFLNESLNGLVSAEIVTGERRDLEGWMPRMLQAAGKEGDISFEESREQHRVVHKGALALFESQLSPHVSQMKDYVVGRGQLQGRALERYRASTGIIDTYRKNLETFLQERKQCFSESYSQVESVYEEGTQLYMQQIFDSDHARIRTYKNILKEPLENLIRAEIASESIKGDVGLFDSGYMELSWQRTRQEHMDALDEVEKVLWDDVTSHMILNRPRRKDRMYKNQLELEKRTKLPKHMRDFLDERRQYCKDIYDPKNDDQAEPAHY